MQKKSKAIVAAGLGAAFLSVFLFFFPNSSICVSEPLRSGQGSSIAFGHSVVYFVRVKGLGVPSTAPRVHLVSRGKKFSLPDFPSEFVFPESGGLKVFLDKAYLEKSKIDLDDVSFLYGSGLSVELVHCQIAAPLSVFYNSIFHKKRSLEGVGP